MSAFKNLVRFSSNGQAHYGDMIEVKDGKYVVRRLEGTLFEDDLVQTEEYHTVDTVRSSNGPLSHSCCIDRRFSATGTGRENAFDYLHRS
jgi:hypothetical protein